jgi:hypothetical protein
MGSVLQLVETRGDGGTRSLELMELGRPRGVVQNPVFLSYMLVSAGTGPR